MFNSWVHRGNPVRSTQSYATKDEFLETAIDDKGDFVPTIPERQRNSEHRMHVTSTAERGT